MKNKIKKIIKMKNKTKIICLTAYSKNFAEEIDKFADIILVGDSLGSVLYNFNTTRKVTLENMIMHSRSVKMGVKKSLMIVDMPYQTYSNKNKALKNAKRIIRETKCDAVKLEGGFKVAKVIEHLIVNKIPVQGHLGILPQSVKGKFKVKGKKISEKNKLMKEAKLLERLGVFSIILEGIETNTAKIISKSINIPTIGIGSSKFCDGQVLVTDDLLGLNDTNIRFVKKFANLKKEISKGIYKFKKEVKSLKYPSKKFSY
ncbi:MAG: 3-methyl-2-oxobutanoate hydroxymethyltransferase [Candidatus Pelagibacter sp. TMED166]|nr:MAG: 3-methyl-2-oxobutanoate hydroxymethyltransferase [Candidatus Pelagibacter sp. TMED166]|tara:strand:- start:726 stop:1502 length:777 start_codon:yes stop_codon:yes gene_type:complete